LRLPFISFHPMTDPKLNQSSIIQRMARYGPVLLWIGLIWFASTHGLSASNTSRIVRPLLLWLFPNIAEAQIAAVHVFTRKAAHFVEYAILAFLARRAFITSSRTFIQQHWFVLSLLMVIVVASLDELHQTFVPSRTGSVYDSAIDLAGGLTVLLLCRFYWRRTNKNAADQ
jgi:VanZ family protein